MSSALTDVVGLSDDEAPEVTPQVAAKLRPASSSSDKPKDAKNAKPKAEPKSKASKAKSKASKAKSKASKAGRKTTKSKASKADKSKAESTKSKASKADESKAESNDEQEHASEDMPDEKVKTPAMKRPSAASKATAGKRPASALSGTEEIKVRKYPYKRSGMWAISVNGKEFVQASHCFFCLKFDTTFESRVQVHKHEDMTVEKQMEIVACD